MEWLWITLALLGAWKLLVALLNLALLLKNKCCRRQLDLMRVYGSGTGKSWVVATGGSDGLGLDYCKYFASEYGFNICIIGRNEEKIKGRLEEIQSCTSHPISTRYVIADLGAQSQISDYEAIASQLHDLDISILLNCAGGTYLGWVEQLQNRELEASVNLNALHHVYLTKVMLGKLLAQNHRSAVIFVSSGLGHVPVPGFLSYSASKQFLIKFGQALSFELRDLNVDVMVYEAGRISTRMQNYRKPSGGLISTETAIKSSLQDLGRESLTLGPIVCNFENRVSGLPVIKYFFQRLMRKVGRQYYIDGKNKRDI